ncbi:MAG: hypothetical protein AAF610_02615 [Pseudomonadota bacterium]
MIYHDSYFVVIDLSLELTCITVGAVVFFSSRVLGAFCARPFG